MERTRVTLGFVCILMSAPLVFASPSSLTYQGRIMGANGLPLEHSSVSFEFRITDPAGGCVLYREQKNGVDMTNSKGVFDTAIGTGTKIYPNDPSKGLMEVLSNAVTLDCEGGSTYLPAPDDGRKLRVQFHDGTGWRTISPDNVIRSVPYAVQAHTANSLAGKGVNDLVLKAAIPVCAAGSILTSTTAGILSCTPDTGGSASVVNSLAGTSPLVVTNNGSGAYTVSASVGNSAGTLAAGDDARFSDSRPPNGSAAGDLSGSYPAPTIAANAVTTVKLNNNAVTSAKIADANVTPAKLSAGSSAGQVLRFNGTTWEHAALSFEDLVNSNGLSPWPASSCGTGQFLTWLSATDNFSCVSLSSSMVTTALGFTPVNAANVGSGANQIPQLDSSGKLPSSVLPSATTVTGTAPIVVTDNGSGSYTVSATVGSASGTLAAGNDSRFSDARPPSGSAGGDLTGNYPSPTIAANAVTTAKILNGNVTPAKLSAGSAANQVIKYNGTAWEYAELKITDLKSSNTGSFLTGTTCAAGEALVYNATSDTISCQAIVVSGGAGGTVTNVTGTAPISVTNGNSTPAISINAGGINGTHIADASVTAAKLDSGVSGNLWSGNGTNVYRTGGSVGIGMNNPGYKLHVDGIISTQRSTNAESRFHVYNIGGVAEWLMGQKTGTDHNFTISKRVAGAESDFFTLAPSGYIGINTTNPASSLHVNGTVRLDQICDQAGANCKTPSAILTGVNSGQVTGALGFTPVNKAGDTMTGRLNLATAGLQIAHKDNISTRTDSGFYQTDTATVAEGWPANSNGWYHLMSATHSNDGNYYSMQFAGDFGNSNDVFYRTTGSNGLAAWNRLWHGGNLTNLNQLTNGPGYINGINSTMVTNALGFTPLGNTSLSGQGVAYNGAGGPQVLGAGNGAAMLSFHRPGSYAVNFGLDTDNVLKVGGWSMGGPHTIWHSGNFNPATKLTLDAWNGSSYISADGRMYGTIFYDSNDTNYYVDPHGISQMNDVRAHIYYDRNNTNFYMDPSGHSEVGRIRTNATYDGYQGGIMMQGNAPSITMQDTDTNIRWMMHNQDDAITFYRANTAAGTDWAQKVRIASDGNIWSAYLGDWIGSRLGQDVRAGTNPNFWNVWLGYRGGWISDVLDQDVRYGSSPTFTNPVVSKIRAGTGQSFYNVEVGGPIGTDGGIVSRNVNNQMAFVIQSAWPGGAGWFWRRLNNLNDWNSGHTDPMVLDPAGTLWVASGYTQASDARLKKEVSAVPDSLRRITELEGVYYYWKDSANHGNDRQLGLIAQEVEKVFPEVVKTNKDGFKAVSYQNLVAPIINALKEVRDWMAGTDARLAEVEAENKMMKEYLCAKDPAAPFCQASRSPASAK